jgi:anti-sigma regulatory factor (Ser/Thr protein kinase)
VISGTRAAGKAGVFMAGLAVRETVTLAGRAERARLARAFVEGLLGPGHPCGDVAALLVDDLFVNSIRHSGSGAPGETVTVAVKTVNDVIRVEVTDRSGPGGAGAAPRW